MVQQNWSVKGLALGFLATCSVAECFNLTQLLGWSPNLLEPGQSFNITVEGTNDTASVNRLFNMGLLLLYNFDQRNAKLVFQEASRLGRCPLCSWGFAHACGPTLNAPTKQPAELAAGRLKAREALKLLEAATLSPKEQVLVRSMAHRYKGPDDTAAVRYAERLRSLRREMNLLEDLDLKVFQAEALMLQLCSPNQWHFYEDAEGRPKAMPQTVESTKLLREVLEATNQTHPYAQHLLIHSTEMSNREALTALSTAEHLLANTAKLQDQHLQHMTSHTYLRTGHYHQALLSNLLAVHSDDAYREHHWMPYGPGHNAIFLVCCALWGGEKETAYKYVQVAQKVFQTAPAQADFPDGSMAWNYPMLVPLRFGEWHRVAQLEVAPPGPYNASWTYGGPFLSHFARSIAASHLGQREEAAQHLTQMRSLMPAVATDGQYTSESLIANHTASAVYSLLQGHDSAAVEALAHAMEVELAMPYGLPPNWLLPTRECYGQALLRQERYSEAEQVFRTALEGDSFHAEPKCGWALLGLRRSLSAQKRDLEVDAVDKEIEKAWQYADVPLSSPCSLIDLGPVTEPLV